MPLTPFGDRNTVLVGVPCFASAAGWLQAVDDVLKALQVTAVSVRDFGMSEGTPGGLPWSDCPGWGQ